MKSEEPDKNKEPSIPDVPHLPNKPVKEERDNDFTKEKRNDPTKKVPSPSVPEPHPKTPNPKGMGAHPFQLKLIFG